METFVSHRTLPSCKVSRSFLLQLEKYLLFQIPRLLQKELTGMRELFDLKGGELQRYSLTVETQTETRTLATIADLPCGNFSPKTRNVKLELRLGRPEILHLSLRFPAAGRPHLELTTVSRTVKDHCSDIFDALASIVAIAANGNEWWHKRSIQALVMLAVPASMVGYGHLAGVEPFFLYASAGWLALLGGLLGMTLPRLFPRVSYHTGRRFSLRKAPLLLLLALNLSAIGGYVWLLAFHLEQLTF